VPVVLFGLKLLGLLLLALANTHERAERAEATRRLQAEEELMGKIATAGPVPSG